MSGYNKLLRSLKSSTEQPIKAIIKGELPKWLNGSLFRNGPGRFEFNGKTYSHLFDGQACVHKFKISDGQVFYSNKLLETQSYKKTLERDCLFPNFGTSDLGSNIFERFKTTFNPPETVDNVNVNVVPFGKEQLYALTETNYVCRLNPDNLKIINTGNVTDAIPKARTTIAHPHVERDGSWITMGMNPKGKVAHYEFFRFQNKNQLPENICQTSQLIASLPSTHKYGLSYFHSFGLTENYIVFLEQTLKISFPHMIKALIQNKPKSHALIMDKTFPTKIHLINKRTGEIVQQKYQTDPQFTFHYINSYETSDSNEIIIDLCSYDPNLFDVNKFTYDKMYTDEMNGSPESRAIPKRIRVPLNKRNKEKPVYCEMKELNKDLIFELPVINYWRNNGLQYKYVYGANIHKPPFSVIKLNVEKPSEFFEMKYSLDGYHFLPTEPVFVERPNPTREDDGVLLVMVLSDKTDFLSILDARDLKELARAELPEDVRGAFTFHGFFADQQNFNKLN
jgi:carotenoid cleavage dioxygenase-like enzyme